MPLDLRDEDLQREIAEQAYKDNEDFEQDRGVGVEDYVRWTGLVMNSIADRLEQAP